MAARVRTVSAAGEWVSHVAARAEGSPGDDASMSENRPLTDERDPLDVVGAMVDHVLRLVDTWPRWDGRPAEIDGRLYSPHKAVRRVADHLVDHLAEIEARLAGIPTIPDRWHASAVTTPADLAPFGSTDRDEAHSRLSRLAQLWRLRLGSLDAVRLDRRDGDAWTIREVAFHVAESAYYADAVGDLGEVTGDAADLTEPAAPARPWSGTPQR
jgi:hypothetical protein